MGKKINTEMKIGKLKQEGIRNQKIKILAKNRKGGIE